MKRAIVFIFFILAGLAPAIMNSQSDSTKVVKEKPWWKKGKQYVLILNDGTEYVGEIQGDNEREILIQTKTMGKLYLPKFQVKSINLVDAENFSNGEFLNENEHKAYYMGATNALPFKKGEFRLNSAYFGVFSGYYSINENISLGIQSSLVGSPMALGLKTSFSLSGEDYVGTEMNIGSMTYTGSSNIIGNIAAKYTRGNSKTNFTVMGGVGFSSFMQYQYVYQTNTNTNVRKNDNTYYFNASVFHRVSKNAGFVGEGWIVPKNNFGLIGIGVRTLKRPDKSWVFGFYNLIYNKVTYSYVYNPATGTSTQVKNNTNQFIPIPYFGVTFKL